MRLICYWQQRRLARHIVLGEPVRPDSFLGKHLASCENCVRAQEEITGLRSDLAAFSWPTITPDFNARLQARFQSERGDYLNPAEQNAPFLGPTRAFPFLLRLALAGSALASLALWLAYTGANRMHSADNPTQNVDLTVARPSRKGDLTPKDPAFHKLQQAQHDIKRERLSTRIDTRPALHAYSPYRLIQERHNRRIAYRIRHRHRRLHGIYSAPLYAKVMGNSIKTPNMVAKNGTPNTALVTLTAHPVPTWREAGKVYAACSDFSRAAQAYGQAFANQPDADLALTASEYAERAGDRGTSLEYYARALAGEANGTQLKPSDPDAHSD